MNWHILNIEPTKDTKAIKRAYRNQLVNFNPEEKPEEFKQLRAAYEEALKLAAMDDEPEQVSEDASPLEVWADKVKKLYGDFQRRIDPAEWKALLDDDVCIALDTKADAEETLMKFFMEYYYLPQKVWQLIGEYFSWLERLDQLYETYPRNFIDFVIVDGMRYAGTLDFQLFTPGENAQECDEYIRTYIQANREYGEAREAKINAFRALSEKHPYGEAMHLCYEIVNGNPHHMIELIEICKAHPQDVHLLQEEAEMFQYVEQYDKGIEVCQKLVDMDPGNTRAKWLLAHNMAGAGNYKDAVEIAGELMSLAAGDQRQINQLYQARLEWNEALIEQYRQDMQEHPEDAEIKENLVWALIQNDKCEEGIEVLNQIKKEDLEEFRYYNLLSQTYIANRMNEEALPHLEWVIAYLEGLEDDGTETTAKRKSRLPDRKSLRAKLLFMLDRIEEASASYDELIESDPDNVELVSDYIYYNLAVRNTAKSIEQARRYIELTQGAYHGYWLLARSCFELRYDQEAFDAVNRAIEIDGSDLSTYIMKALILIRNGAVEPAKELLEFLRENGVKDDISVAWCEALITERETEDKKELIPVFKAIVDRIDAGEHMEWVPAAFYKYAIATASSMGELNNDRCQELIYVLDRGLKFDSRDIDCMDYKAWLLAKMGKTEEAIALYHEEEKLPDHMTGVERQLANLYYKNLSEQADLAFEYYNKLLEIAPDDPDLLFYAGMCKLQMGKYKDAEELFLREMEFEPDVTDGPFRLTYVYEAMGKLDKALEYANIVIDMCKEKEGKFVSEYLRKEQILRRMNRPLEAIEVIDYMREHFDYKNWASRKAAIYAQFNMFPESYEIIEQWKTFDEGDAMAAKVETLIMEHKVDEARKLHKKYFKKMSKGERERTRRYFDVIDNNTKNEVLYWENYIADRDKEDADDMGYAYMHLALAAWRGKLDAICKQYAEKALHYLDISLGLGDNPKTYLRIEALFRSRRAVVLALLGRFKEAEIELELTRHLPLCDFCKYCYCKDTDIFEAYILAIKGEFEASRKLSMEYIEKWPDEVDFVCHYESIKNRG